MDTAGARQFLYDFGKARYTEASVAVLGAAGELRYGGGPDRTTPANDKYWAKIVTRIVDERQETLRLNIKRYVCDGLVFVQLFAPITDSRAQVRLDKISEMIRNTFRVYQGAEIEFTEPVINDNVAAEPNWLRSNIVSNYAFRQFI
jgi:hypothetical protein